jgi:hypothetical protein
VSSSSTSRLPSGIPQGEHRRHPRVAQQLGIGVDACRAQGSVRRRGVGSGQPDAGVDTRRPVGDQREGRRPAGRPHLQPAAAAEGRVEALLQAERARVEGQRPLLVAHRNGHGADPGHLRADVVGGHVALL